MKKKILLPVFLLLISTTLVAQRSSLIYAISAPEKQTNWENIQLLNSKQGVVLQTVFDPSKQKLSVTDAVSNTAISRTVNGKPIGPTATTVAAAALDLPEYDRYAIHLSRISAQQTHDAAAMFATSTREQRLAPGYMHPGRVDVIAAGSLVLSEIMKATGASEFVASESDILDGMAFSLARN